MLPIEILQQILLQLSRDDLDAVELVNRHLRSIILSDIFVKWGPLWALDELRIRPNHTMIIGQGQDETEYPTNGALLKDMFVRRVLMNGRNEDIVRWFFTVLPRMRLDHLEITVPAATQDFQEQLFSVLKCRQISVTLGGSTEPAVTIHPDDVVALMYRERRNLDNDAPSDVVVGPRSFKTQSGYERSLYMTAAHVGEGGVKQLVAALREKAVSATVACPPFLVHIAWAKLEAHELPPMRHLNRATGQHFVVNCVEERSTMIKCITVLRPRK
ncbi:hypothetical protein AAVH_18750 [Aphelenchoides avenae]|nr:hypothetical protein AAVH_18750 [Aphelenchus avenae]